MAIAQVGNGHVVQDDQEVLRSLLEGLADQVGNLFSLGKQLASIILGNNRFEDLVDNGRKDSGVVVSSQVSVQSRKSLGVWSVQNTK